MKDILFSIVIATFNCETLIKDTLNSIISQDDELYECIVVDGLSTDKTVDIIKKYSENCNNITYISEKDNGVYDAMNKGIDLAKGKYLYFIGAGDRLCEGSLKNMKNQIKDEDFIYGNVYLDYENVKIKDKYRKSDLIYAVMNHQSIFYKRDIFNKIGKYDLKYKVIADNVLNKYIFGNDDLIKKYVDVDIAHYLGEGISQNYYFRDGFSLRKSMNEMIADAFGKEYLLTLYKNFKSINTKKILAWGNGGEYRNAIKYKKFDFEYFVQSVVKDKTFENKDVKNREQLLLEKKENLFILVFSGVYYQEIREWLEKNNFKEFENFILVTEDIIKLLIYLNII